MCGVRSDDERPLVGALLGLPLSSPISDGAEHGSDVFALPSDYDAFSSEEDVDSVANYPTDLNAVTPEAFDRISRHGYEVAERTLSTYHAAHFEGSLS